MVHGKQRRALALLGLVVLALAHGASLWDGLFFDDYWHRVTLRTYGWGFNDLVESATFDLPGRLVNLWPQEQPLRCQDCAEVRRERGVCRVMAVGVPDN